LESVRSNDLKSFDEAFFSHMGFIFANATKSFVFGWTDARFSRAPASSMARYYQLIHKYSTNLAFLADFSMVILGGELKRKEKLSARLGDMLSCLYMTSAVLKRFHDEGELKEDVPLVSWCCQQLLHECETALHEVIINFPKHWARIVLRLIIMPLGQIRHKPDDKLGHKVAQILIQPCDTRQRLTRLAFSKPSKLCPLGRLEEAFHKICAVEELERKVTRAVKDHTLKSLTLMEQISEALNCSILSKDEAKQLTDAELARQDVIRVDDFADEDLRRPLN
jgi:acyl-CoA dehydrogenase